MRILIVSQYFWPENFRINDFVIGIFDRGHEITVLTGKPNYPGGSFYKDYNFFNKRKEFYNRIKIIRCPLISRGRGGAFRLFLNYFSFAFFASFNAVFRIKGKFDLIFVHEPSPITVGIPAIILKKRFGIPLFFWVLDLWPESVSAAGNLNSKFAIDLLEKLVKYIYKKSDIIFISSKSFRKSIKDKGVSDEKIKYLPNWAEDLFLNEQLNNIDDTASLPFKGFKIIFAGNIGDAQDFESIVSAVELTRSNENIQWIIIGEGRKKSWVEQQKIEKKLDNLNLLGKYPIEKMPYFLKQADALLVSLKNEKIFRLTVPAKIQAYLACGRPVIAMLDGDGADIITESKAGYAIAAGDFNKLAEIVVKMSNMAKSNLDEMAFNAKKYYADNFNRNKLIDFVLDIFRTYSNK